MVWSFFPYGLYKALSMAFKRVSNERRKSLKNVQNRVFSSAGVMFRVTCKPENRDSGNDEHRILRLLDVLNHVVGFMFHVRGHLKHPLLMTSEIC